MKTTSKKKKGHLIDRFIDGLSEGIFNLIYLSTLSLLAYLTVGCMYFIYLLFSVM